MRKWIPYAVAGLALVAVLAFSVTHSGAERQAWMSAGTANGAVDTLTVDAYPGYYLGSMQITGLSTGTSEGMSCTVDMSLDGANWSPVGTFTDGLSATGTDSILHKDTGFAQKLRFRVTVIGDSSVVTPYVSMIASGK